MAPKGKAGIKDHLKVLKDSKAASKKPSSKGAKQKEVQQVEASQEPTDSHITDTEKTLRLFDLTGKFGPCSGMTRMERWERAASFRLEPPQEVKDILDRLPKGDRLHQNIWHGRL
jgi:DNA polymerase delta subunit 4